MSEKNIEKLELMWKYNMSADEIAEILEMPVDTVIRTMDEMQSGRFGDSRAERVKDLHVSRTIKLPDEFRDVSRKTVPPVAKSDFQFDIQSTREIIIGSPAHARVAPEYRSGFEMNRTLERLSEFARSILNASELLCLGASPFAAIVEFRMTDEYYRLSLERFEPDDEE